MVEEDGSLTDIKVRRKFYPLFDEEALRVVRLMPKWKPMYSDYQKKYMKCGYTLPIKFKLE
jgi:Gram-negative bacterial TonB protein C-terminal